MHSCIWGAFHQGWTVCSDFMAVWTHACTKKCDLFLKSFWLSLSGLITVFLWVGVHKWLPSSMLIGFCCPTYFLTSCLLSVVYSWNFGYSRSGNGSIESVTCLCLCTWYNSRWDVFEVIGWCRCSVSTHQHKKQTGYITQVWVRVVVIETQIKWACLNCSKVIDMFTVLFTDSGDVFLFFFPHYDISNELACW